MPSEQVPREDPVVEVFECEQALVLRLAGELDLYNAPALRKALRACAERAPRRLVVDLSQVTFVDSTALGALVEVRSRLPGGDGLALAAPGLETRRALALSGLDRHLAVHESVEAALS